MGQKRIYLEFRVNDEGVTYTFRNNWGTRFVDRTEVPRQPIGGNYGRKTIWLIYQNGKPIDYGFNFEIAKVIAKERTERRAKAHAERRGATLIDKTK